MHSARGGVVRSKLFDVDSAAVGSNASAGARTMPGMLGATRRAPLEE